MDPPPLLLSRLSPPARPVVLGLAAHISGSAWPPCCLIWPLEVRRPDQQVLPDAPPPQDSTPDLHQPEGSPPPPFIPEGLGLLGGCSSISQAWRID